MPRKIYHLTFVILTLFYLCPAIRAQTVDDGKKLLKNESFTDAVQIFKSLSIQNNNPEAWYYLGETYFEKGDLDSAKLAYQNGIKSKSDFGINYAGLAKVFYHENNIRRGIRILLKRLILPMKKMLKLFRQ